MSLEPPDHSFAGRSHNEGSGTKGVSNMDQDSILVGFILLMKNNGGTTA